MEEYLIDLLECPACHQPLRWEIQNQEGDDIQAAEAVCTSCHAAYPVREGIGIFLSPELPRNDLWELVGSKLGRALQGDPDLERRLMDPPIEALGPTDQQLRALVLDERRRFGEARGAEAISHRGLYTQDYLDCWESQVAYLLGALSGTDRPVVDLASGRCYLVERMLEAGIRPVVATDFSVSVLRRDREYFNFLGVRSGLSFVAFDAQLTPFKKASISTMTSNLGLANIENPAGVLEELKRIVGGSLLAISFFFPEDDEPNRQAILQVGLETFLYRHSAVASFSSTGWHLSIENACLGTALPTPTSAVFEGMRADGLPVAPTELEWCTLKATS